jgi:microcystin-dependent protein
MFQVRKHKKLAQLAACLGIGASLLLPATEAEASCGPGDSVYLGSVCTTAINFCPRGYTEMAGQLMAITENQALFSLLGCTWGGDCRASFALPDMRGRAPIGAGLGPGLTAIKLGQSRGSETHVLTSDQLTKHSHKSAFTPAGEASVSVEIFDGNGNSPTPSETNKYLQTVASNPLAPNNTARLYGTGTGTPLNLGGVDFTGSGGTVTIGDTGNSSPFNIQGPVMALTYCMATEGIFPPRH